MATAGPATTVLLHKHSNENTLSRKGTGFVQKSQLPLSDDEDEEEEEEGVAHVGFTGGFQVGQQKVCRAGTGFVRAEDLDELEDDDDDAGPAATALKSQQSQQSQLSQQSQQSQLSQQSQQSQDRPAVPAATAAMAAGPCLKVVAPCRPDKDLHRDVPEATDIPYCPSKADPQAEAGATSKEESIWKEEESKADPQAEAGATSKEEGDLTQDTDAVEQNEGERSATSSVFARKGTGFAKAEDVPDAEEDSWALHLRHLRTRQPCCATM